ncbi:MAG: tryptophan synthase subunit alpha [Candidatus Methanoliparum thermophilum]|uniref:Tryptophan synthase alpha chain n=1 Tax=Methanoliparum thermophilum TaxID=2491083 RepID=A0A520KQV1_METT2|nr:tryptophan synthase subunit alpha [Candidatus Methanoliparum sp. LAM-1]RZN63896.1 MAG: tryptophan synthase subunit alpha [Candidatus Methanoliparum thermophilum]BDC36373.1 tryptophan synthase subunit alpha [Candidatus Methanoliparum sp. LAM-1]
MRISEKISESKERNEGVLVSFIIAGDPDKEDTIEYLYALDESSDIIELGIPFSDPVADGRTIQEGYVRALKNGFKVSDVFDIVKKFRERSDTPIVLMTYYNIVYIRGLEKFLKEAKSVGVDGLIVVDLPVEEGKEYIKCCKNLDLDTIFLIAPNTSRDRIVDIDNSTTGFIYLISLYGTTGVRNTVSNEALELLKRTKDICRNPLFVGFGISNQEQVASLVKAGTDGVVVGSTFVDLIGSGKNKEDVILKLKEKAKELKSALYL